MKISIVVPTFREELNIKDHYEETIMILKKIREKYPKYDQYEYFVIDNCSDDKTVDEVLKLREKDKNIKLFVNDKNYGPVLSPFTGLINSTGDVALLIAADLQEPPKVLIDFVDQVEKYDCDAAIGVKKIAKENFILWRLRGIYYRLLKTFGLVKITSRYSGFGLYKRDLIEDLNDNFLEEPSLRILLPMKTSNIKVVFYKHLERKYGFSSYNIYGYFREAIKTIIRNSTKIPSLAAKIAVIFTFLSILLIPITVVLKLIFWQSLGPGIASIIILLLLINSGILLFMSLILDRQGQILARLKPVRKKVKQKYIYE